jgi:uncharacterized protein
VKILLAAFALAVISCGQNDVGSRSNATTGLTGRVVDQANLLDPATEQALSNRLAELEAKTSDQLVVVTINTLDGQPIENRSLELANSWGIGRADVDNGVLLLVAPNERKVRVEVGLGLEGLLTDQKAASIIQTMLPHFREGRIQDGIIGGVSGIETLLLSDKRRPQPKQQPTKVAA